MEIAVTGDGVLCSLGLDTAAVMNALEKNATGVKKQSPDRFGGHEVTAALFSDDDRAKIQVEDFSFFESLLIRAMEQATQQSDTDLRSPRTLIVLASTKGNIGRLESSSATQHPEQISLGASANRIAKYFGAVTQPQVVSNACISGISALIQATRMIRAGHYDQVVVAGADEVSPFIQSGFQSFMALSDEVCKPYDAQRKGINLGEAAAAIVLKKTDHPAAGTLLVKGGASANDANHLSGPSRTGEELAMAVTNAMKKSGLTPEQIDFISAHGTATSYNDEMESKAFERAGLSKVPLHSLKSRFGHTLGAAGVLESVVLLQSMRRNLIFPTFGFETMGVSGKITVCDRLMSATLNHTLKTGSGFGGCNAAIVFSKA